MCKYSTNCPNLEQLTVDLKIRSKVYICGWRFASNAKSILQLTVTPRSHDGGTKLCQHKMNTVCNCSHDTGRMSVSSLFVFSYVNVPLIIVDNNYDSQNVSS